MMVRSEGLAAMRGRQDAAAAWRRPIGWAPLADGSRARIGFGRDGQLLAAIKGCKQCDAHQDDWR